VQVELATHTTLVLILGIAQPADDLDRFAYDFAETIARIQRPGLAAALTRSSAWLENEVVLSPREAFLGTSEPVDVDDAIGRVSAEAIAGYPPGIPALLPGERVTAEVITYLRELVGAGARLHGASDPAFRTLYCVSATTAPSTSRAGASSVSNRRA
jgi:arginine decarboxylase